MLPPELVERCGFGNVTWEGSSLIPLYEGGRFQLFQVIYGARIKESEPVSVTWVMLAKLSVDAWEGEVSSPVFDLAEAGIVACGSVKWDGCSDTRLDFHGCGPSDVEVVLNAVARAVGGARHQLG